MTENHEPRPCASCGAVNPWMNETCRICGAAIHRHEPAPETTGDEPAPGEPSSTGQKAAAANERPGWSLRWILAGFALFLLLFVGGEKLIEEFIVAADPELTSIIEEQLRKQATAADQGEGALSESDKERLRSALFGNRALVVVGSLFLLLTPLMVGLIVGYFSGAVRNGALACGLGTLAVLLLSRQVLYGLLFGLLYAGLGALGAVAGAKLRQWRSRAAPTR